MTDPTGDALRAGKKADAGIPALSAREVVARYIAKSWNYGEDDFDGALREVCESMADEILTIIEASGEYVRANPCADHLPDAEAKARAATRSGVTVLCGKCGGFGFQELTVKDVEE